MSWGLVTGAAKRLGRTLALTLARKGQDVVIHYHLSRQQAEEVAKECRKKGVRAETLQGDFSSAASTEDFISRYLEKYPETSLLINNVGNFSTKSLMETETELLSQLYQDNVFSAFALIQALKPSLIQQEGMIVNIGAAGVTNPRAEDYAAAYMWTKQSLYQMTLSFAKLLAKNQVRVNMISPGILDNSVDIEGREKTIPMGRLGTTEEIAHVLEFLLEEKNGYTTGQNIEVAGGFKA